MKRQIPEKRLSEQDLRLEASIHGLEIISAPMCQPKIRPKKVLVSKPALVHIHQMPTMDLTVPDLEIEMMPSEASEIPLVEKF